MKKKILSLIIASCIASVQVEAHTSDKASVKRNTVSNNKDIDIQGNSLTSLVIELKPGAKVGAHKHDGVIYAYVLQGQVKSQLGSGEIITYQKGQAWVEPKMVTHKLTENPSETEVAKLLVVFIAGKEAKLTVSME